MDWGQQFSGTGCRVIEKSLQSPCQSVLEQDTGPQIPLGVTIVTISYKPLIVQMCTVYTQICSTNTFALVWGYVLDLHASGAGFKFWTTTSLLGLPDGTSDHPALNLRPP